MLYKCFVLIGFVRSIGVIYLSASTGKNKIKNVKIYQNIETINDDEDDVTPDKTQYEEAERRIRVNL